MGHVFSVKGGCGNIGSPSSGVKGRFHDADPEKILKDIRSAGYFNVLAILSYVPMTTCASLQVPSTWPLAALFTLPFTAAFVVSLFSLHRRLEAFVAASWVYLFSVVCLWLYIAGGEGVCSSGQQLAIEAAVVALAAIAMLGIRRSYSYARVIGRPMRFKPQIANFAIYAVASIVYWVAFFWAQDALLYID